MAALEQSLDVPAIVARLTTPNADRDQVVARARELMDKELLALADDIATHPEIGFEEKRSVRKLVEYLQKHDFSVETGSAGLTTAFVAKYRRNNGGPTLGIILEYDALRGTKGAFHGDQHNPEPGKPQGYEETGSVSRDIPGIGITAQSSTFSNHTYEMDADNLKEVGHKGFTIDAQTMAAVLFDFASRPDYRAAVKKEFDGIKVLFGEYQEALKKVYTVPTVPEPK